MVKCVFDPPPPPPMPSVGASERPPLGLKPKITHDIQRTLEILEAMSRYASAGIPIPLQWVQELADLYPYQRADHFRKD